MVYTQIYEVWVTEQEAEAVITSISLSEHSLKELLKFVCGATADESEMFLEELSDMYESSFTGPPNRPYTVSATISGKGWF